MASRLDKLKRIVAVQSQIVRHSELQVARADKLCVDLAEDKERLREYVTEQGALGVSLAKAAMKSMGRLDRRLQDAEILRERLKAKLLTLKRREHAAEEIKDRVQQEDERKAEDRELGQIIEAWLATKSTSLP